MAERPAEGDAPPEDHHLAARRPGCRSGRAAPRCPPACTDGPGHAEREAAHVGGVQPVDVLVRVDRQERGVEVDLAGRGVLHEHGVDRRIVVEARDAPRRSAWVASAGRCSCGALDPELRGLGLLHARCSARGPVVADQDRRRARRVPAATSASIRGPGRRTHRPRATGIDSGHVGSYGHRGVPARQSGGMSGASSLEHKSVQEVAFAGEDHGQAELVGRGDDLVVAAPSRPAGSTTATPASAAASMPSGNG